jgi:hypothetical protein
MRKHFGWGTVLARATAPPEATSLCSIASTSPQGGGETLTLIHARQNKQVSEEMFSPLWRRKIAFAFRMIIQF